MLHQGTLVPVLLLLAHAQAGPLIEARQATNGTTPLPPPLASGQCGKDFNQVSCPGACCSEGGSCGTDDSFCRGLACQVEYSDLCGTFIGPNGTSTRDVSRTKVGTAPYGTSIQTCVQPGMLALTYDDGPHPQFTKIILDTLAKEDVKATFFVNGKNAFANGFDKDPQATALLQRMISEGHQVGSHTWTHRDLDGLVKPDNASNLDKGRRTRDTEIFFNEEAQCGAIGRFATILRAPFLSCTDECLARLAELGYRHISVNVDTRDFEFNQPDTTAKAQERFANALRAGGTNGSFISLTHDIHEQTAVSLTPFMIKTGKDLGFRFVTVAECLGDSPSDMYRECPRGTGTPGPGKPGKPGKDKPGKPGKPVRPGKPCKPGKPGSKGASEGTEPENLEDTQPENPEGQQPASPEIQQPASPEIQQPASPETQQPEVPESAPPAPESAPPEAPESAPPGPESAPPEAPESAPPVPESPAPETPESVDSPQT